jgi:hypothetical protein
LIPSIWSEAHSFVRISCLAIGYFRKYASSDNSFLHMGEHMTSPKITVLSATYGTAIAGSDVTNLVQAYCDANTVNGIINLPVENATFNNCDPSPGMVKRLTVTYVMMGTNLNATVGAEEHQTMVIKTTGGAKVTINSAWYADSKGMSLNLNKAMGHYFSNPYNGTSLTIGSAEFFKAFCGGQDPSYGNVKICSIKYTDSSGTHQYRCAADGETINVG